MWLGGSVLLLSTSIGGCDVAAGVAHAEVTHPVVVVIEVEFLPP